MNKKIGLDCYSIHEKQIDLLNLFRKNELCCFYISERNHKTIFYARIRDRHKIKKLLPDVTYEYTCGLFGMLLRNFTNRFRVISYVLVVVLWCVFSNTIFAFEVYGESDLLEKKMYDYLDSYWLTFSNKNQIKKDLYKEFKDEVSWLEVYDEGNVFRVQYVTKDSIENKEKETTSLVAKKDGMIAYFDCSSGYKVKRINDIVKKGDVLVDSTMKDSYNKDVSVKVKGRVMAYTWSKVTVEIKDNKLPDAIHYFSLLLEARSKINISIEDGEKIIKENILQFDRNEGKIKLILLYTLLEDITS